MRWLCVNGEIAISRLKNQIAYVETWLFHDACWKEWRKTIPNSQPRSTETRSQNRWIFRMGGRWWNQHPPFLPILERFLQPIAYSFHNQTVVLSCRPPFLALESSRLPWPLLKTRTQSFSLLVMQQQIQHSVYHQHWSTAEKGAEKDDKNFVVQKENRQKFWNFLDK